MQDWGKVREVLREEFAVEELGDGRLQLTLGDQTIDIELGLAFHEPWLTAIAPIVPAAELARPRDALELNGVLSVGALAILDDLLVFRWAQAVRLLDRASLDRSIRFVAREATRLRNIHEHLVGSHAALDFLVD